MIDTLNRKLAYQSCFINYTVQTFNLSFSTK